MYKEKETKNLSKILNAKYYNYAPYKYLHIQIIYIYKINTTNREIKVDTCPLPRWTLKNDLFWKMQLQIVIHVYLYHR